jgi:PAT family beta-lactamase induction signal transducer AmpG
VPEPFGRFGSRRVRLLPLVGFASGLPYLLGGATLSARLSQSGVDLTTLGLFALVALPYSLKFLWAPLLDRFTVPLLGRRRGWMVALQLAVAGAIAALGAADPRTAPLSVAALALVLAFFSASLDVVSDAYNADVLEPPERGPGGAAFVLGYRTAMLLSGGLALILADHLPWRTVYFGFAAAMLVGVLATLFAPEPATVRPPASLGAAVAEPLYDYFTRPHALAILLFVTLYRLGDTVAVALVTPFLLHLGFGNSEIGAVNQGVGLAATIVGTLIGGGLVERLGLYRALLTFGVLQALTNAGYCLLAVVGPHHTLLVVAVAVDNLCTGLATTASVAFLLSLCNPRFSATQFALLTSTAGLAGRLLAATSGYLAARTGFAGFFGLTIVLAAPALALLVELRRRGVFR